MTEDEAIDRAVAHYLDQGWQCLYRTARAKSAGGSGEQGGADAIFFTPGANRFLFLEAKGTAASKVKASTNFTNALGAALKRIRLNDGYMSNEAVENFAGETYKAKKAARELIKQNGTFTNSEYVLALPNEYRQRAASSVDENILALIHVSFLWVEDLPARPDSDVSSPNGS